MRLSSIFSFSTYQARWRLSPWLLYLLIFMALGEGMLRIPAIRNHLPAPEPTLWHAADVQSKIDYLEAFESQREIDILFIGNSMVQAGMNPHVFDQIRGKQDATDAGTFNAAIDGLPPYGASLFLEIYLRQTQPKTIIYGLTPQDLNSNSPWAQDVTDRVKHAPLVWAKTQRGLQGQLTATMLEYSALYRYRFVLHQLLLRGGIQPPPPQVYFDAQGFGPLTRRLSDVPASQRHIFYNNAGVVNYSTQGIQLESLKELIAYCTNNDIELILVNMPLSDDYYGNFDTIEDYQTYLDTAKQVASEFQVPFWDMENLLSDSLEDIHFADFNHLNDLGAEKFSTLLAERYLTPDELSPISQKTQ